MDGNIYIHRELIFSLNSTLCDNSSLKNGYFRINIQIGTSPSKDKKEISYTNWNNHSGNNIKI